MVEQTNKATHEPYSVELFAPVIKETKGDYLAVLSDTSLDRDEERVGLAALEKISRNPGYIAGLIDHENKVLNQVAEWTNINIKQIDGHHALVAEPKFFLSNPNAKVIKGMLDEGARLGISIGAIVKSYEDQEVEGKSIRTFTDLELLEASFVAIPSNRHGRAMAVAKSFKNKEKTIMTEEQYTKKDLDLAIEKETKNLEKSLESTKEELSKLQESSEEVSKQLEEAHKEKEALLEEKKSLQEEVKELKAEAIEKQNFSEQGGAHGSADITEEDIEKMFSEGKLPLSKQTH